jgi:hypothetical protein
MFKNFICRKYAAPLVALMGITSMVSIAIFAPTLSALGNDATSKYSLLTHHQMDEAEAAATQLTVRNEGFSFNRLFAAHRLPLNRAETNSGKNNDAALALYMTVIALLTSFVLIASIWKLAFKKNAAFAAANTEKLYSHEIFLHDNALFSQTETASSSPPTPDVLEERFAAPATAGEKTEEKEKEIFLSTPPRVSETQQPIAFITPIIINDTNTDATEHKEVESPSGSTLSLGPRASLKLPSTHSPSARAPTHKTQIDNDAFVTGNDSDVYNAIDNTDIWEAAPIRIFEPTLATVAAVAGEEDAILPFGESGYEQASKSKVDSQQKPHWKVEDLKKELKATQDIVAALKRELSA